VGDFYLFYQETVLSANATPQNHYGESPPQYSTVKFFSSLTIDKNSFCLSVCLPVCLLVCLLSAVRLPDCTVNVDFLRIEYMVLAKYQHMSILELILLVKQHILILCKNLLGVDVLIIVN
jgi:hypothetical protein